MTPRPPSARKSPVFRAEVGMEWLGRFRFSPMRHERRKKQTPCGAVDIHPRQSHRRSARAGTTAQAAFPKNAVIPAKAGIQFVRQIFGFEHSTAALDSRSSRE
jgi:hypothetical protein